MTDLAKIAAKFLDAFHENPGHSDLDREQPITITVTLGDLRDLNYALNAAPQVPTGGDDVRETSGVMTRKPPQPAEAASIGPNGEDKRRIDACVRACEGFQTEWLEQNSFWSYALLTSDEYAELVVAKRELARLSATLSSDKESK